MEEGAKPHPKLRGGGGGRRRGPHGSHKLGAIIPLEKR
jgi:hypothetical protein